MRNASMKEPQSVHHWVVGKPMEGAKACELTVFWCNSSESIVKMYNKVVMERSGVRKTGDMPKYMDS